MLVVFDYQRDRFPSPFGSMRDELVFCSIKMNDLSHVHSGTKVPPKLRDTREANVMKIAKGSLKLREASVVAPIGRSGTEQ